MKVDCSMQKASVLQGYVYLLCIHILHFLKV